MKKQIVILFFLFNYFNSWTQIIFEKGYIIDNNNQKIDCLIKNVGWKNNPSKIKYKVKANGMEQSATVENINEFGIGENIKYVKVKVGIDRSSELVDEFSKTRRAELVEEVLFLKTLVEGKASLYQYIDGNLQRFFYQVNGEDITQLVYKFFVVKNTQVKKNERYKQQLTLDLNCKSKSNTGKLNYREKDLTKFFKNYNQCANADFKIFNKRKQRLKLQWSIKPGVRLNTLKLGSDGEKLTFKIENKMGYSIGFSAELNLRFNKNKWAAILEPTFQSFKGEQTKELFTSTRVNTVDYQSIEIPIGIRHYFFINNNSKVFVNGFLLFDLPRSIDVNGFANNSLVYGSAFGAGYSFKSRLSLELRYFIRRDLLSSFISRYANLSGFGLVLGCRLF